MDPKKSFKTSEELVKEIERLGAHLGKQPGKILDVSKRETAQQSTFIFSIKFAVENESVDESKRKSDSRCCPRII